MKLRFISLFVLLALATAGCNTVSGAVKDIEAASDTAGEVAEETKENLNID